MAVMQQLFCLYSFIIARCIGSIWNML